MTELNEEVNLNANHSQLESKLDWALKAVAKGFAVFPVTHTRWHAEGRCVRIATPPSGKDFNDLITQEQHYAG